jgi:DNA anti-recombination protein RmuC
MTSTTQQGMPGIPPQQQGATPSTTPARTGAQQEQGTARPVQPGASFQGAKSAVDRLAKETSESSQRAADRIAQTSHRAASGLEETGRRAASEVADQRAHLSERIRNLGGALRASGDQLEPSDASIASLLERASDQAERVASYVDRADPSTLASDLTRFARERPAWFYGGAFIAGLALGRFAKASTTSASASGGADGRDFDERGTYPVVTP